MLIILDRDGVINQDSDDYVKNPDEWIPIEGSLEAIARLNQAGHQVVVATNQSGISRNLYRETDLAAIHEKMQDALAQVGGHLDGVFYCSHHPDKNCACRKPKPGLLLEIAKQFPVDFKQNALMVGDTSRDILAAQAVHCPAVLVKTGKGMRTLDAHPQGLGVAVFKDLAEVVQNLLQGKL